MPLIEARALTKRYGSHVTALDELNLAVEPGIIGLVGANGAGKSTFLKILLGLLEPTRGTAQVLGFDTRTQAAQVREQSGALLEFPGCAVIITHDRWFLDRIATHILAFEGDSKVVWFDGNYSEYETDRKSRLGAAAEQPHRIKYRPLTRA